MTSTMFKLRRPCIWIPVANPLTFVPRHNWWCLGERDVGVRNGMKVLISLFAEVYPTNKQLIFSPYPLNCLSQLRKVLLFLSADHPWSEVCSWNSLAICDLGYERWSGDLATSSDSGVFKKETGIRSHITFSELSGVHQAMVYWCSAMLGRWERNTEKALCTWCLLTLLFKIRVTSESQLW